MKISSFALLIILALGAEVADAQIRMTPSQVEETQMLGIGPAISGSCSFEDLPATSKKFIEKHFKNVDVMNIEKEFGTGEYDVTLANGIEMDFNKEGLLTEIEGLNSPLPLTVIREILPQVAYKSLQSRNAHTFVRSIEIGKYSYEVEFVKATDFNFKEMKFDSKGNTIKVETR